MKTVKMILLSLLFIANAQAYELPSDDEYTHASFESIKQQDGTYKIYLNMPHLPNDFVYHTKPADIIEIGVNGCSMSTNGAPLIMVSIFYKEKYPPASIFYDEKTRIISAEYPGVNYSCDSALGVIYAADDDNKSNALVVQPIFENQPKVWLLVQRKDDIIFAYSDHSYTNITNKVLALYTASDIFNKNTWHNENIVINDSIFKKLVSHPTCYVMPEDHELRLCSADEAKLRTPALKTFLGESK